MPPLQARLGSWLRERGVSYVGPSEFAELLQHFTPISPSNLRRRLRSTGLPLHPLAAGVDQDSFSALRATLLALAEAYESAPPPERRAIRDIVITAKDHARLAARNPRVADPHRAGKEEMAEWMITWLENPAIFALWVSLRSKMRPEFGPG